MSDKIYEDRTTEEIKAINDIDINTNKTVQKNKYKIPFIIVAVSLVILLITISINYIQNPGLSKSNQAPSKDEVLKYISETEALRFEYEGKDLSVENSENVFTLLNSDTWTFTVVKPEETEKPQCTMKLDNGYTISFYDELVGISRNEVTKYYKTDKNTTSTLCGYLEENTYISVFDMSSLLSVSENLTLEISGISCTTTKGQSIANALNTSTWSEILELELKSEPFLTITDPIGLTVKIYEEEKTAIISYKGNSRYYSIDELVPASVALAAKSAFDAEALKIADTMEKCEDLIVVVNGDSFRINPNATWSNTIDFNSWTRRYKTPAAVPENADITVFDDISFVLKIYEDLLVAEYDNSYYNISETVISSIKSYFTVTKPEENKPEIAKFSISEFISQIMKQQHLHADFSGKTTLTTVTNDIISALSINSWTETNNPNTSYDTIITTDESLDNGGFNISLNTEKGLSCIKWNEMTQYYKTQADLTSVTKYIQNNVYTEVWQISATELGTLQNAATSVETVITDSNSNKKYLSSETIGVTDISKLAASLNLTPIENKPEANGTEKTEMTFKTETNRFLMTCYKDKENRLIVFVSGTLSDIGRRIDRMFVADGGDYDVFVSKINDLIERNYDVVAGTFVEAIKSMNSSTLNDLTGNVFDYCDIANVKFNSISFEKTSEIGKYLIKLNVADPADGPFETGESNYILLIGSIDGSLNLKVKALTKESEYNKSQIEHNAVATATYFASWYMSDKSYFNSFDKIESKKAAVDYLMLIALREELNTVIEDDPMGMYFKPEVINKMALKYFNCSEFDATDTSAYNNETNMYSYSNAAVPVDLKRVVDFEEDHANNKYYVTIKWYEDPMYLYETKTVVYTLDRSSDGTYRILSATDSKPETGVKVEPEDKGTQSPTETDDETNNNVPSNNEGNVETEQTENNASQDQEVENETPEDSNEKSESSENA